MADKTCFVVMGFNKKTDPVSGRVIDLDKTYKGIIKPAVTDAGFKCERADEIQHARLIDIPMYERLLNAELVVADLSALNPNAFFELGVRYALRPRTTIVIAESGFKNPFDTNHIATRHYRHDGEALDFEVVEQFRAELTTAIKEIEAAEEIDSPVYSLLHGLTPPQASGGNGRTDGDQTPAFDASPKNPEETFAHLIDHARSLRSDNKFEEMAAVLRVVRDLQGERVDDYVIQQLGFAIYKSEKPNPTQSYLDAIEIFQLLDPDRSLDGETIGLWGAVHKRLADAPDRSVEERRSDLDTAIDAYSRGFCLLQDYYNGINAAFLYDLRASRNDGEEAVADRIAAKRIREKVLEIANALENGPPSGEDMRSRAERLYWIEATHAEALFGLGKHQEALAVLDNAASREGVEPWMRESTESQLGKLEQIQQKAQSAGYVGK